MKTSKTLTQRVLAVALLAASTLFGQSSKLSGDLQTMMNSPAKITPGTQGAATDGAGTAVPSFNVIVQFSAPSAGTTALNSVTSSGGTLKQQLQASNAALYNLTAAQIQALNNNSNVKFATPDRKLSGHLEFAQPTINANIAKRYGYDGTGVGVAVIDSGILSAHGDLQGYNKSRVVYSQSFVPGDTTTGDAFGHGTHVAGIIGGNGKQSTGSNAIYTFMGIAPNVNLINLRVLDANGSGTDSTVINAIYQAIQLKSQYNIRVLNLSLGRQVFESYTLDPLCQAVEAAWKAGIVVVVAAGNNGRDNSMNTNGYSTITAPGNDPYVITVGAMKDNGTTTRADDLVASYSSKGPALLDLVVKPDLVAPGNSIVSALSTGSTLTTLYPANLVPVSFYKSGGSGNGPYLTLSGTSMATPMVSGAAALLIQKDSTLTPDTVKARLMKTATKNFPFSSSATDPATGITYTSYYDLFTIGAGYLDAWAALNSSDVVPAGHTAISPTVTYNATTKTISLVNGTNVVWGDNVVWGSNVVWGTSVVSGTNVVWGSNVVWGDSTVAGFNVVWGSNVVWGDSNPFAMALSAGGEK